MCNMNRHLRLQVFYLYLSISISIFVKNVIKYINVLFRKNLIGILFRNCEKGIKKVGK